MDFPAYFIILSQFIAVILDSTLAEECKQDGPCKCTTSKGTIDLKQISSSHKSLDTPAGQDKGNPTAEYHYHLCLSKYQCGAIQPMGAAMCQNVVTGGINYYYTVGMQSTAAFTGDPAANSLQLHYTADGRSAFVKVLCDSTKNEPEFKVINEKPEMTYNFELTTKLACLPGPSSSSGGLSTGSVMLIIFFVLVVVYLVAGVLFMKYAKGAQGAELVPNLGFWKELPGLIRDGILFVFHGCKKDTAYSQI